MDNEDMEMGDATERHIETTKMEIQLTRKQWFCLGGKTTPSVSGQVVSNLQCANPHQQNHRFTVETFHCEVFDIGYIGGNQIVGYPQYLIFDMPISYMPNIKYPQWYNLYNYQSDIQ